MAFKNYEKAADMAYYWRKRSQENEKIFSI